MDANAVVRPIRPSFGPPRRSSGQPEHIAPILSRVLAQILGEPGLELPPRKPAA